MENEKPGVDSDFCECGLAAETPGHILLDCPRLYVQREKLQESIERAFVNQDIPGMDRRIDLETLLGPNKNQPMQMKKEIKQAVNDFLHGIACNI